MPAIIKGRPWLFAVPVLVLAGCGGAAKQAGYEDRHGFTLAPPPGWSERARDDLLPARLAHKRPPIPLPPLETSGRSAGERLLVRYDRVTSGSMAWLRVTATEPPASAPLKKLVAAKTPGPSWKRQGDVEDLEVGGLPAVRVAYLGRWENQDYLCETVAVRKDARVYYLTGSFPAADGAARDQVRQSVAQASLK
jgi:hypothetical protein